MRGKICLCKAKSLTFVIANKDGRTVIASLLRRCSSFAKVAVPFSRFAAISKKAMAYSSVTCCERLVDISLLEIYCWKFSVSNAEGVLCRNCLT